jgi:diaminopimelate decarboxylase
MNHFHYQHQQLMCEQFSLDAVAKQYGTPAYVYSRAAFTQHYGEYRDALGDHPGMICYAVKANSNIAVLNVLAKLGAGFDIVSTGELERVIHAGGDPQRIVFSGVAKTEEEMRRALELGVYCFNVESIPELSRLQMVAESMGVQAPISLRVNPDVDAETHPYISTGLKENKFGVDIDNAVEIYQHAATLPNLTIKGVDCHIGSQLTSVTPFLDALDRVLALIDQLATHGITIEHLDLGGGLGVVYDDEQPPKIGDYIGEVKRRIAGRGLSLSFEPGRSIAANAGVLLTKVEFLKPTEHKNFAIIDAGMNDNIRPALYQAWQKVLPLIDKNTEAKAETATPPSPLPQRWDLVGPVCETGDFLAKDRELALNEGDYLALMSSGAYGFTMSSNYNSRGRAVEVMIDDDKAYVIRQRETVADLVRGEALLPE